MTVDAHLYREEQDAGQPEESSASWFQLASYPDRTLGNPHLELLYKALSVAGVQRMEGMEITCNWLDAHAADLDAIHIHWPERIWRGKLRGRLDRLVRAATLGQIRGVLGLKRFLKRASALGIKRVWTIHNFEHHEGATWIDHWGYRTLARECDLLITYAQCSAEQVISKFGCPEKVLVMRHGNYSDCYQSPRPRNEVLGGLGLDVNKPTLCCVGIIRSQKGLDIACYAVQRLSKEFQLLVAGQCHPSFESSALAAKIDKLSNAVWLRKQLNDQEFSDIIAASDAVLLPYLKVTGSGVLHAAWSLGRGVVASDLPYFRETIAPQPDAGELFATGDSSAMAIAVRRYLEIPEERRRHAAHSMAAAHDWDQCVEPLVNTFRQWESERSQCNQTVSTTAR